MMVLSVTMCASLKAGVQYRAVCDWAPAFAGVARISYAGSVTE